MEGKSISLGSHENVKPMDIYVTRHEPPGMSEYGSKTNKAQLQRTAKWRGPLLRTGTRRTRTKQEGVEHNFPIREGEKKAIGY